MSVSGWNNLSSLVRKRVKEQVVDPASPVLPVAWPNASFETPEPAAKSSQRWVRVNIDMVGSNGVGLGGPNSRRFRIFGLLIVQVFTPPDVGDAAGATLADGIASKFRGVSADGVHYTTPSVNVVGLVEGWYAINVNCPFYADLFA